MVARPEAYRWSSYCATAGYETAPQWLETGWLLGQFSADRGEAQALYRAFVDEKLADRRSLRDNLVGRRAAHAPVDRGRARPGTDKSVCATSILLVGTSPTFRAGKAAGDSTRRVRNAG
jgi:hypothetical protein